MIRKRWFVLCAIVVSLNVLAQNNVNNIINVIQQELKNRDFASASTRLILLETYVSKSNITEYKQLVNQLNDSIYNTYNRANDMKNNNDYQRAIVEYQKLIGMRKEPLVSGPLYAYIGYCYEARSDKELAKSNYEEGIKHNENLSALRMARFIKSNNITTTTEEMITLYEKASNYSEAMDSLGIEYFRINKINDSYKWFKASSSSFGKYKLASYLLDTTIEVQLSDEYKEDNPIQFLTDAANDNYAPAQYYLGLLYYFAEDDERVPKDESKGLELINKAAKSGYEPAKRMKKRIDYNF